MKFEDAREKESLGEKLNYLIEHPEVIEAFRTKAANRVKEAFKLGGDHGPVRGAVPRAVGADF